MCGRCRNGSDRGRLDRSCQNRVCQAVLPRTQRFRAGGVRARHGVPAEGADLRGVPVHEARGRQGGDPRTGPLPRGEPGPRTLLLGVPGDGGSAVAGEHLRGASNGPGVLHPEQRLPRQMGEAGRSAFDHGSHGAGASGELSPEPRMGEVHRLRDRGVERRGPSDRVYALGKAVTEQALDADEQKSPDPDSAASESAVRIPRVLRMQAFQQGQ